MNTSEGRREKVTTDIMATFHEISSQNLECPICLSLFNQPTSLTCSHTFCKDCLERIFETQLDQRNLTCPVCRKETLLPSGGASKLQTNIPLSSLVDKVKSKNPTCTDCGKYMCESCEKNHSTWGTVSTHEVVPMSEVLSGKVPLKRRRKCKKHPKYDEDCFCTGCGEYICCTCGVLDHLQAGHQLEEAAIHEENILTNIKALRERGCERTSPPWFDGDGVSSRPRQHPGYTSSLLREVP
ncbi:E3 ubiquitin-protein ligase TRIM56-like [Diadema antillarum]|uniref:E3 ubiquitin-protein ligase TRIM56-like n=1 Tax=Diadema antillarum TaxID=105358 RepID=UPI003A84AD46